MRERTGHFVMPPFGARDHLTGDTFALTTLARVPIPEGSADRMVCTSGALTRLPDLARIAHHAYVPAALAPRKNTPLALVRRTGGRTFLTGEDHVTLDLAAYGLAGEGLASKQECGIEVKGGGCVAHLTAITDVHRRKIFGRDRLWREQHLEAFPYLTSTEATLSRPWGGQSLEYALASIETTESDFGSHPVRFTPTLAVVPYPARSAELTHRVGTHLGFTGGGCIEKADIAQEIRLTPSAIRGMVFAYRSDRESWLLEGSERSVSRVLSHARAISDDPSVLGALAKDVLRQGATYLRRAIETATRYAGAQRWECVGDFPELLYKNALNGTTQEWCITSNRTWLAKDVVLAPSGMWFTDLESFHTGSRRMRARTREEMVRQHQLYALGVLRECGRIAFGLEVARRDAAQEPPLLNAASCSSANAEHFAYFAQQLATGDSGISLSPVMGGFRARWSYPRMPSLKSDITYTAQQLLLRKDIWEE